MKTKHEWLAFYRDLGFDNGDLWHVMSAMYALGLVRAK